MDVCEAAQKGWLVNCVDILYMRAYHLPGKLTNERNRGEVNRLWEVMYEITLEHTCV